MRVRRVMLGSALVLGMVALVGLPTEARPVPAADSYSIDSTHSSVVFRIMHMNLAPFYGQFDEITGSVSFDEAQPTAGSLEVSIKVDSVHTHSEKRNGHLKSPDFFNAPKFPTMTFASKSFAKAGENAYDVAGDLTIHGVTKPVTVKLEKTGAGKMQGAEKIGFESVFTIKRSDYGITFMPDGLGDEVKIMLGLEAARK